MDGLFHGKSYEQMDNLGVPLFSETPTWGKLLSCLQPVNRFTAS